MRGYFFYFFSRYGDTLKNVAFSSNTQKMRILPYICVSLRLSSDYVGDVYQTLIEISFHQQNEEILISQLNYFEDIWLGRSTKSDQRRTPLFSVSMWNV